MSRNDDDREAAKGYTSVTKVSKLVLEGRHGEQLSLRSRHTTMEPVETPAYRSVLADSGCLNLTLELVVDSVRCPASHWKRSGTMRSFLSFMRENAKALQIDAVEEPVVLDQQKISTSLLLKTFPAPLKQHLPSPSLLQRVALSLLVTSNPAGVSTDSTVPPVFDRLVAKNLDANIESLLYQGWQKLAASLASKYPLIFIRTFVQTILLENRWLDRAATSLDAVIRGQTTLDNTALSSANMMLRAKYASPLPSIITSKPNLGEPHDWEDVTQQCRSRKACGDTTSEVSIYRMAMFDLLLHCIKRKRPLLSQLDAPGESYLVTEQPVAFHNGTPATENMPMRTSRTRSRSVRSDSDDEEAGSSQSQKRRIKRPNCNAFQMRHNATPFTGHEAAFARFFSICDVSDAEHDLEVHFGGEAQHTRESGDLLPPNTAPDIWQSYDAIATPPEPPLGRNEESSFLNRTQSYYLSDMVSKACNSDYNDKSDDDEANEYTAEHERGLMDLNARMAALHQSYQTKHQESAGFGKGDLNAIDQRMMLLFGDDC